MCATAGRYVRCSPVATQTAPPRPTIAELERWLASLEKPVGILAWDAEQGHFLREACASAGFRIPDEVAIVSGEDDELLCTVSYPPLSAVDCGSERVGYEAAALLARCLAGENANETSLPIAPLGVLARHSTDVLAMEDRELAKALEYLRKNAYGPLHVRDVLRQVPLCACAGAAIPPDSGPLSRHRAAPVCGSPRRKSFWSVRTGQCLKLPRPPASRSPRS